MNKNVSVEDVVNVLKLIKNKYHKELDDADLYVVCDMIKQLCKK